MRARHAYECYTIWSDENGRKPLSETRFGRVMGQRFERKEVSSANMYFGIELHDIPPRTARPRNPDETGSDRP